MRYNRLTKKLVASILMGLAGFIGNWFALELFFNVDYLWGSIAVMLTVLWIDGYYGVAAGFIAGACTYFLWNHPWAVLILTGEALFVSWMLRRWISNLLICDMLYWILLGAPMVYFFYHNVMGIPFQATTLIMLKQSNNGIFNALMASIIFMTVNPRLEMKTQKIPLQDLLFIVMVSLVILPNLILLVSGLRKEMREDMATLAGEVDYQSQVTRESLSFWIDEQRQSLATLAGLIGDPEAQPVEHVQHLADVIRIATPAFEQTVVMNTQGISIAFSPQRDASGRSALGIDYSDHPYIPIIRKSRKPYISDVIIGRHDSMEPILPMVAPLLSDNTYRGLCGGVINLARVRQILTRLTRGNRMNIILLDRNRKVAATTRPDLQVMEAFRRPPGSVAAISGADAYHWVPMAEPGSSIMKRWGRSYLFKERRVSPELDWIIIVQGSVAPILDALTQQSILTLLISNLLIFFSVMLSYFISRSLTRRLKEFQAVTNTLPLHLSNVSRIDWPTSKIDEVHQLIDNFRQMALALGDSFRSKSILNQRLNEAQRISRVGSWELDLSTGTLSCSDEIYRIFELDRRRAISHEHLLERVHPEDRSMVRQAHTRAIQNKGGFESTHRLLMDDGRVKTVHKRSEIFTGDDGALQRYLATIHDITEIREAEEALRASEEKFRILFERAADAIFIHDPSGRMLAVNQTACERLGYTHRELLTKSMPEVESAEWAKLFSARIEYLDRCGQGVFESAHATRGGQSIPVELHCRKMVYEKIPAIMTMARDITIRKQDEETILSSLREKEILLREIHHRVKNNLQIVSSLFSLQANKSTDQRVTQALLESRQRIHAMAMIHETLYMGSSLAAIELPVYLQKLIDHLREVFSGQAGIRTIVDAQNIAMNVDQAVACGLIINELITNSLKYAFPGTDEGLVRVTVHPREDGQTMEMVVSDNGVGLPEGLDLSSIPSLGLQLVRGLVEHQLAGSLDVQTNGGTTFTIQWRLPDSNEAPS